MRKNGRGFEAKAATPPGMHRRTCSNPTEAGFTLIEVMIAAAIMAFSLTSLVTGLSIMTRVQTHFQYSGLATTLTEYVIEDLLFRSRSDDALAQAQNGTDSHRRCFNRYGTPLGTIADPSGCPDTAHTRYVSTWTILETNPTIYTRTIILQTTWQEMGTSRNVTMRTIRN